MTFLVLAVVLPVAWLIWRRLNEVFCLSVRDGRVQFVGSVAEAMLLRGPDTRVIDAAGKTVIPGMTDAHAHLFGLGEFLRDIDLTDTRSYEEIVSRIGAKVAHIQRILGIKHDGLFGPRTRHAVVRFQHQHHLVVDGVVGPKTRAALRLFNHHPEHHAQLNLRLLLTMWPTLQHALSGDGSV